MKSPGLLVATVVLLVLVGLLYWSKRSSSAKTPEASVNPSPKILALNQADIDKLEIKKKGTEDIVLTKDGSGDWHITAPKDFRADSNAVSGLLSTVSTLNAERVVDEKANDLRSYGLAPPAAEVVVTEKDNKSQHVLIGDDTPTHNGAYAALAGDPKVYTIAAYNKTSLDKGLNDLRDKRLLTLASDKVNRLELLAKKSEIEFDHYGDHWQIIKPKPLRADSSEVDDLVRKLTDAKIDLNAADSDQAKAAASFSKAEAVGKAKLMSGTETQDLDVRKAGNDYYAKSSAVESPSKVSNDLGQAFSKSLEDFRNKKLFDFGYTDPNKIEFHDGAKTYFLTRGGSDWWGPDGKKMDATVVYSFLDKLRDLKAGKFVDSGFETPAITIVVTSSDGKNNEKVLLSKNGANYIAKRENEPSLCQVDAKTVDDLEHAATELKPATGK
jgi:hypothetical protein